MLEGTVDSDLENALRIYEFDVESSSFNGLVGYCPTTDGNPIGDFTPINDTEFLVIEGERDIDNNEVILIDLETPLNLDPNLGGNALTLEFLQNTGDTEQPAQMIGLNGYEVDPIFTIGEEFNGYAPPGILDGLGAYAYDEDTVRIFANHELRPDVGYVYTLDNGTEITGARVSYFDINQETLELEDTGLAYDTIINRAGEVVDEASDLEFEGLNRFCSAQYIEAHQFGEGRGLEDSLFFTGEETFGGTEFVLDPASNTLYAVPWMGRAAWESTTELDTGTTDKVALLVGDDREAAPLLLYVGEKDISEGAGLLERNGLTGGKLYTWVPDEGADTPTFTDEDGEEVDADDAPDPEGFNGTGNSQSGTWVELDYYRPDLAGSAVDTNDDGDIQDEMGYDDLGFATQAQQDQLFIDAGGFQFSRPEDVATNPEDGTEAVLASTGRGGRFEEDNWGTTYKIDTEFNESGDPLTAQLAILYDGDDAGNGQFEAPDFGLRSPDNLEWADDGKILIQEDRSTVEDESFGGESGEEASIWELDPDSGVLTRVAQMNRDGVPEEQSDPIPEEIGEWESSGIIDVSDLFGEEPGTSFIFGVQAHSLEDGIIATEDLVEGGQLAFLTKEETDEEDNSSDGEELTPVFGTSENDTLEAGLDFDRDSNLIFVGEGEDVVDLSQSTGDNRTYGGEGDDVFILGKEDRVFADAGDDRFFVLSGGDNVITGNLGADQFWIANAEFPQSPNTITDFTSGEDVIGIAGLGIGYDDLSITDGDSGAVIAARGQDLAIVTNASADFVANEEHFVFV